MDKEKTLEVITDEKRLSVLQALDLLDTPVEEAFDRLTRLASKITSSPVSLVSLLDVDRQFFKSFIGLGDPYASTRETPLSHSFCQYVTASQEPLIVEDARQVDFLMDNLAIPDLDVISYLGMPLVTTEGFGLGSFCVIDSEPRKWTAEEIDIVRELAISVMSEIELRAEILKRQQAESELEDKNRRLNRVFVFAQSTIRNMKHVIDRGAPPRELGEYIDTMEDMLDRL